MNHRDRPQRPMHDVPALSVLVPTQARPDQLRRLLDGLARQTLAPLRFEVILVDDGSLPEETIDAKAYPFPLARLSLPGTGPAAAANLGLERCRTGRRQRAHSGGR